jgi:hypothetical protein
MSKFQAAPVQTVLLFQIDLRPFGVMLKRRRHEEFIIAASASCHRWNSIPEPLNNLKGALYQCSLLILYKNLRNKLSKPISDVKPD